MRLYTACLLLAGLCAGGGTWAGGHPMMIGKVVPPYPEGYRSNTGSCVGTGTGIDQLCTRSIVTLDDAEDRTVQLLAAQFVDRVGDEPRWRITDALPYPALRRDELVAIATCQRDGVDDTSVVAIIDTGAAGASELDMLPAARWAMRLDRASGKFLRVQPSRVRCYNEGSSE
ncbi:MULTISPECIES: hypothetical protein [unclassified Lysobacter]|uniref:hypothetical protein n=1 Tax=unclassified Lysobacter TaxID=2635362 RepID=UPI001C22D79F|nr:hypothetical protein [Lysobacter sp. MMG2]MBU8976665.1 hypothetical protein [Lysobacter sp. MMG2]